MKKAKIIKAKTEKMNDEIDSYSLKKLIVIIIIVAMVFAVFYFITTLFVHQDNTNDTNNSQQYDIDDETISLNHLLDMSEKEYYVIAYKNNDLNDFFSQIDYYELYEKYISNYSAKEDSLKFYKVNLSEAINRNYLDAQSNITNSLEELKINDETLFKIVDKKIDEYYIGSSEIIKKLSEL